MELPEYSQYQLFICGNEQWLANGGDPKIETDLINEWIEAVRLNVGWGKVSGSKSYKQMIQSYGF